MENYLKISRLLTDLFDKIDLEVPSNFNVIVQFIVEDLQPLKDDIDGKCVANSFKRWIQNN